MQNWMRRSQQTLEQWFAPDTARGLDAFIEGMTLHFVTDRAPLSKAAIRLLVGQLAGERGGGRGALRRCETCVRDKFRQQKPINLEPKWRG